MGIDKPPQIPPQETAAGPTPESAPEAQGAMPGPAVEAYESLETSEERLLSEETGKFAQRLEGMRRHEPEAEQILAEWEQWTIGLMQEASDRERLAFRIDLQRARLYVVLGDPLGAVGLLEGILVEATDIPGFVGRAPDLIERAYANIDRLKGE